MGLPKITLARFLLMLLITVGGPPLVFVVSQQRPWLALILSLLLVLIGRYGAPAELRRFFTTILSATAFGTAISSFLLWLADDRLLLDASRPWHILVITCILVSGYLVGYGVVRLFFRTLAAFSIDFLSGLDTYLGENAAEVRKFLTNQYLGIGLAYQIVEDGRVSITKPAGVLGRLGGRGLLLVKPANALVTEWGGEIRRVLVLQRRIISVQ